MSPSVHYTPKLCTKYIIHKKKLCLGSSNKMTRPILVREKSWAVREKKKKKKKKKHTVVLFYLCAIRTPLLIEHPLSRHLGFLNVCCGPFVASSVHVCKWHCVCVCVCV